MKKQIVFNRAYIAGLNEIKASPLGSLNTLKQGVQRLLQGDTLPYTRLESLARSIGQLERLHAPKEICKERTNTEGWTASACSSYGDQWEQWIQIANIPESHIQPTKHEHEVIAEQTVVVGSDRKRMHIEWGSGRKEGYIHSKTSRWMAPEDFLETTPPPPNCLMALPAGCMALYGYTLQTGITSGTRS